MIEVALLALAYLAGVGPARLAVLALAVIAPVTLLPLVAFTVHDARRRHDDRAVMFCDAVASELRSGSSLAVALESAAISIGLEDRDPVPGGLGLPERIAELAGTEFEEIGAELKATIEAAARAGGRVADLFDEIGALAIAHSEIAREVRVASAPARATAWFFLLAPSAFLFVQVGAGGLDGLVQAPAQRIAAAVGMALFLLGLGGVATLIWRAR